IFYIHVPIALTAYFCFGLGAWKALRLLWLGEERYDLESYVAIHQGTIFGALTLLTGSIWAKASWSVWWTWSSRQLVLFLVLFLVVVLAYVAIIAAKLARLERQLLELVELTGRRPS